MTRVTVTDHFGYRWEGELIDRVQSAAYGPCVVIEGRRLGSEGPTDELHFRCDRCSIQYVGQLEAA